MNSATTVITAAQARDITGGSRPFSIAEYDDACEKLRHCLNIDDTLKFKDFAGARAYWAKVNGEKEALKLCVALDKLASRHLAELAILTAKNAASSLLMCSHANCKSTAITRGLCNNHYVQAIQRKENLNKYPKQRPAVAPSAHRILKDAGMNRDAAKASMRYARIPEPEFKKAVEDGVSKFRLERMAIGLSENKSASSDAWALMSNNESLRQLRSFMRKYSPETVAASLKSTEIAKAKEYAIFIVEYFDRFEQCLSKRT
jgi:hypothetical protein